MSRILRAIFSSSSHVVEDGEDLVSDSLLSSTGAMKWIKMTGEEGRAEPVMTVSEPTAKAVLKPLGRTEPVNLVAIFGAARGGKSFLMNQLAGRDGIFKISNEKDPCTQGVDVSRAVVPLRDFAAIGGVGAPSRVSGNAVRVLFADVEGQGDRDVAYDARLASAILPLAKCVIFNWRDSLQVDRILNLLGVMQRAAHNVDLGENDDDDGGPGPKFGHLHVVFRDWNYSGTAEEVKKQLFGLDKKGMGSEVALKNELRRTLKGAFTTITVWLFPPPVEMTSELSKELSSNDLSQEFTSQLGYLRGALSSQLASPTLFDGKPVTGHSLASLVPALVDVLNKGEVIMPRSAYEQMIAMESQAIKKKFLSDVETLLEDVRRACDNGPPIAPEDLVADIKEESEALLKQFRAKVEDVGASQEVIREGMEEVKVSLQRGMEGLVVHNRNALTRHLKAACKEARVVFARGFGDKARAGMPMSPSALSAMAKSATDTAKAIVAMVPSHGDGDGDDNEAVKEALSALNDHIELTINKVERQNAELLAEVSKKEEGQLTSAIHNFSQNVDKGLRPLKAGGKPYQISVLKAAIQAASSSAVATLTECLSSNGCPPDRMDSLVGRLKEKVQTRAMDETSLYRRACTMAMLKLAQQERDALRTEVDKEITPLLPIQKGGGLEAVYKPVLQRAFDRVNAVAKGWSLDKAEQQQCLNTVKSDAESVWEALCERNERVRLQHAHAKVGEAAVKHEKEAEQLREHLKKEKMRAMEAEGQARNASEAEARAQSERLQVEEALRMARSEAEAREEANILRDREQNTMEQEMKEAQEREREELQQRERESREAQAKAMMVLQQREMDLQQREEGLLQAQERERVRLEEAEKARKKKEEEREREKLAIELAIKQAAAARAAEAEDFADAMDVEDNEDPVGSKDKDPKDNPKDDGDGSGEKEQKKRGRGRPPKRAHDSNLEDEEPRESRRKSARNASTTYPSAPLSKEADDPLKQAREEAAKLVKNQAERRAGAAKGKEGEGEGSFANAGLSARELSKRKAKEWAKQQKEKKAAKAKAKAK